MGKVAKEGIKERTQIMKDVFGKNGEGEREEKA